MIVVFILVSGSSASVVRAGIMAIIVIISDMIFKKPDTLSSLAFSALLILIFNPYTIFDIGFIMSFGGTIGIILFNNKVANYLKSRIKRPNKLCDYIIDSFSVTASAQIILIPIMWYYFNTISIVSFLTNLLVGVLACVITIAGIVTYFVGLINIPIASIISYPISLFIELIIQISRICSSIPFGNLTIPTPSISIIFIYYLFVASIYLKNDKKHNKVILIFKTIIYLFVVINLIIYIIPKNYLEVNFVDVGQGDCIHIKTSHNKNILIDSGGSEQSSYNVGTNILVPYLLDNTNGIIDTIIISHFHEDHAEGAIEVLKTLKVNRIIIGTQPKDTELYTEFLKISKEKNIPIFTCTSNNSFYIDGIKLEVLYPKKDLDINEDLNNNSMIMKANIYGTSILFTGDAEDLEENELLKSYSSNLEELDVDILKVGHHGSKSSSTEEFLKAVSPNISIISCGVNNKFGHPHKAALERIEKYCKNIFRTDQSGEISLKIYSNSKISIKKNIE